MTEDGDEMMFSCDHWTRSKAVTWMRQEIDPMYPPRSAYYVVKRYMRPSEDGEEVYWPFDEMYFYCDKSHENAKPYWVVKIKENW